MKSTPLRILLLEDSAVDATLVERALVRGGVECEVLRAVDRESYEELLHRNPDLVLSDYNLPKFDGLSALRLLREHHRDVPFILVSGTIGEELAVAAMREGAADYLLKDRLSRLPSAVRAALEQLRLRREKQQLEQRLLRADRLESLGQLAAGVAHDLNNILLPILMSTEMLRDSARDAHEAELLATVQASAERGAKVLKQLLAFGRGTSGERVPVVLSSAVKEIAQIIRETFPKDISVTYELDAEEARVLADPTQIQQVLMNLCVNARDAMPDGGALLVGLSLADVDASTALSHPGNEPGVHAVLRVRDSGMGIAPGDLGRIFDPFFTTKAADQGTGLGLSSVLGIVKSHAGFIQVESELGAGAEFRVFLPLLPGASGSDPRQMSGPRQRGSGQLVLLVDDESSVRGVLRASLSRFGYRVLEADDGITALELFRSQPQGIGALVTDLSMPRLDGVGLLREIRASGSQVSALVMMGAASSAQTSELEALGVKRVLYKPFGIAELLDALGAVLGDLPLDR